MDSILASLLDLEGMRAVALVDGEGRVFALRGDASHDDGLVGDITPLIAQGVASVERIHQPWETMQVSFEGGALLLGNLGPLPEREGRCELAAMADLTLELASARDPLRVAVQSLRTRLSSPSAETEAPVVPPLTADLDIGGS